MKVNIKLNKTQYSWNEYDVDHSEYKKIKYLTIDDIAERISHIHGINVTEIKKEFSKELLIKYENNTNEFIKKQILRAVQWPLTKMASGSLKEPSNTNVAADIFKYEIDLNEKIIKIPLDYSESVSWYMKNRGNSWAKWITNYMYGNVDTKGEPFKFGDREKITYLENLMISIGEFELTVNYDNKNDKWKLYYYKPIQSTKKISKKRNRPFNKKVSAKIKK
jgi:hypothetical protein